MNVSVLDCEMNIRKTAIPDVLIIEPRVFADERGFFMETFQARKFAEYGLPQDFVQDNHSGSKRGTLRGLHYQIRHSQGKLVRAVVGEVYDIAVDIRRNSPTFGKWIGIHLSAENKFLLWIPPGFAHGFYVLSKWAEIVYKATDYYSPQWERSLLWNDQALDIKWPLVNNQPPMLTPKDAAGKTLAETDLFD